MSKRSKNIVLARMRKHPKAALAAVVGGSAGLAGCSSSEPVTMVVSIDDCQEKTALSEAQCEFAYKQALAEAERTAPKFQDERDCEDQFGFHNCTRSSEGFFTPAMTGFLVAEIIDEIGDAYRTKYYSPVFRNEYRRATLADGTELTYASGGQGSYRVPKSANKPKATVKKVYPKGTKTINRKGFGSTASAKSSWGGGSSSRSWGG
ncbi:hypothetical protein CHH28_03405 [Bacterioplanes sanyensis]|uniref:DUF1190 domain-containing protein n=1 Tax=Bacterioplanes sanyensis TaxID=1249553 RepID=A0A222FFI8_9GAMM|nr:DUF1190 domain-containing protein [Bacterioplanes sanyensis]ASP37778.1 hypothetical protein CHH28_03405 [Bacterioplanes sanyensis]